LEFVNVMGLCAFCNRTAAVHIISGRYISINAAEDCRDGLEISMIWFLSQRAKYYIDILNGKKPDAKAEIRGSLTYPDIVGKASFYQTKDGVLLNVEVMGLPSGSEPCGGGVFGFHIHEGESCTGNAEDPFADAKGHYNPHDCRHPQHAGDLPPLFEAQGRAFMVFLTGRFTVKEIIGKTIIIHASPDDFTSQPAGNAGKKMACGKIRK
jgi:Cu-Zn family superoxide dismutase